MSITPLVLLIGAMVVSLIYLTIQINRIENGQFRG